MLYDAILVVIRIMSQIHDVLFVFSLAGSLGGELKKVGCLGVAQTLWSIRDSIALMGLLAL